MGWGLDIEKDLLSKLDNTCDEVVKVAQELFRSVVSYSPTKFIGAKYAEGVFVNSWYVAVNEFDPTVGAAPDMSGSGSLQRIAQLTGSKPFARGDGYISLSNSLDYSENVEYTGWVVTGPYAPVRQAITYMKGRLKT